MKPSMIVLLVVATASVAMGQRSFYAQRPVGIPEVMEQFKPQAPANAAGDNLATRLGGAEEEDTGPLKLAPGTIGDPYLTPRLADWPKEHQPFWYLNSQHIMNHRGQKAPAKAPEATQVEAEQPTEVQTPARGQRPAKPVRPAQFERPARPARPLEDWSASPAERNQGGRRPEVTGGRRDRPNSAWQNGAYRPREF